MKVLTGSKHCRNQDGTTNSRQFGENWVIHLQSILRLFVNFALTADDKFSDSNMQISRNNFKRLSKKQKIFSGFFIAFLKWAWNLEHFQKKMSIPAFIYAERRGYLNVKILLQNTLIDVNWNTAEIGTLPLLNVNSR